MARKRGGLAGLWDRNKGAIKAIAPMALGAIPGIGIPLAAGARAAMEGLDRPGKGGIGFDIGEGLKGAAMGAVQGYGGKQLAGGVKGLFSPSGAATPASPMPGAPTPAPVPGAPSPLSTGDRIRNLLTSKEGMTGIGQAATAGASILGSQRQADLEQERLDREQREAEARAQLMALFAPQMLSAYDRFGAGA